jgi:hypothetical protein
MGLNVHQNKIIAHTRENMRSLSLLIRSDLPSAWGNDIQAGILEQGKRMV